MGIFIRGLWQGTLVACALAAAACNGAAPGGETQAGEDGEKTQATDVAAGDGEGATGSTQEALATPKCIDIRRDNGYLVQDSFIASNVPDVNWGTNVNVLVGKVNGNPRQSVFKFDTSSIPKRSQIISAQLKLYILNNYIVPAGTQVKVYRATTNWTESNVSWNLIHPGGGNAYDTTPVASFTSAPGMATIDLKTVVQKWVTDGLAGTSGTYPNQGLVLEQAPVNSANTYTTFRSSETNNTYGTNYPTLSVCYVVQGPPASSIVNAGTTSTSTNYKAVYTLGQSTSNQGKMTSPGFRSQGGIIGATGTLP